MHCGSSRADGKPGITPARRASASQAQRMDGFWHMPRASRAVLGISILKGREVDGRTCVPRVPRCASEKGEKEWVGGWMDARGSPQDRCDSTGG